MIGQAIGIPVLYIQRPIVGLKTNYNQNYTSVAVSSFRVHMVGVSPNDHANILMSSILFAAHV
jgi:hypothetical protein